MSQNKKISVNLSANRSGSYNTVSILSLAMNTLVLGAVWLTADESRIKQFSFFGASLGLAAIFLFTLRILNIFRNGFSPAISLFLLSITWALLSNYLLAVFNILLAILAWKAKKPAKITFSDEGISLPRLIPKCTPWNEVSAVLLRDQVLTMDFKNNQLIQLVIDPELNPAVIEPEFNAFCTEQISKAG